MPLVMILILGFLTAACLLRPAKAGEIAAVGVPAGAAAYLAVGRAGRSIAADLGRRKADIDRLHAGNAALERRVDALLAARRRGGTGG